MDDSAAVSEPTAATVQDTSTRLLQSTSLTRVSTAPRATMSNPSASSTLAASPSLAPPSPTSSTSLTPSAESTLIPTSTPTTTNSTYKPTSSTDWAFANIGPLSAIAAAVLIIAVGCICCLYSRYRKRKREKGASIRSVFASPQMQPRLLDNGNHAAVSRHASLQTTFQRDSRQDANSVVTQAREERRKREQQATFVEQPVSLDRSQFLISESMAQYRNALYPSTHDQNGYTHNMTPEQYYYYECEMQQRLYLQQQHQHHQQQMLYYQQSHPQNAFNLHQLYHYGHTNPAEMTPYMQVALTLESAAAPPAPPPAPPAPPPIVENKPITAPATVQSSQVPDAEHHQSFSFSKSVILEVDRRLSSESQIVGSTPPSEPPIPPPRFQKSVSASQPEARRSSNSSSSPPPPHPQAPIPPPRLQTSKMRTLAPRHSKATIGTKGPQRALYETDGSVLYVASK
ncbi:hypothetical protein HDU80_001651 [Chytriomyces hyalinus]|nr:hypothetical protein HDU80_001651 [Chytriomyces hyalinus]